jgi:hypothetical protein
MRNNCSFCGLSRFIRRIWGMDNGVTKDTRVVSFAVEFQGPWSSRYLFVRISFLV